MKAIVYDIDGKNLGTMTASLSKIEVAKKVEIGKKVEVTYTTPPETARFINRNLAISVRYVPADYLGQPGISSEAGKPNNSAPQSPGQGGANSFIGTIEYTSRLGLHIPPGRTIRLSSGRGDKLTVFVSNDIAVRDMNAAPTRIGKRAEIKYAPAANGENEAISFRYLD